jgi:predicted RNase H-like nuclease (RuvC/YqgF family)
MYRQFEDIEEIDRLDRENSRLFVENRELKKKLERKKYKIQCLKENLATALVSINDVERIQYESCSMPRYRMCNWRHFAI